MSVDTGIEEEHHQPERAEDHRHRVADHHRPRRPSVEAAADAEREVVGAAVVDLAPRPNPEHDHVEGVDQRHGEDVERRQPAERVVAGVVHHHRQRAQGEADEEAAAVAEVDGGGEEVGAKKTEQGADHRDREGRHHEAAVEQRHHQQKGGGRSPRVRLPTRP